MHKLLLTNRQVAFLWKSFGNNSSAHIKLSKTQLSKTIQSGGVLGKFIGPLLKPGLPLIKNVIKQLANSVLIPVGLSAAVWATDERMHKKILTTALITSDDERDDIIKIIKSFEDSEL